MAKDDLPPDHPDMMLAAIEAWRAYQIEGLRQQVHIHEQQLAAGKPIEMVAYTNERMDELYREAEELTDKVLGPFPGDEIVREELIKIHGYDPTTEGNHDPEGA